MLPSTILVAIPPLDQLQHHCQESHQHPVQVLYREHHQVTHDSLIFMTSWKKYQVTSSMMRMKESSQDLLIPVVDEVSTPQNTWIYQTATPALEAIFLHLDEHPQVGSREVPRLHQGWKAGKTAYFDTVLGLYLQDHLLNEGDTELSRKVKRMQPHKTPKELNIVVSLRSTSDTMSLNLAYMVNIAFSE